MKKLLLFSQKKIEENSGDDKREKVIVYFADSYSSWQKGAIENANKLIRKYIPKKSNFDAFSDKRIMKIQMKINRRPRETLNFDTPIRRFFQYVV